MGDRVGIFKSGEDIVFVVNDKHLLRFCDSGSIQVKGKAVAHDRQVTEAFRAWVETFVRGRRT